MKPVIPNWTTVFVAAAFLSFTIAVNCCHAQKAPQTANPSEQFQWTDVPTVDRDDPTVQRGIVYGPDGKPLPGAKIYAASNMELFELRKADEVDVSDLGEVRAVTDQLGRFQFHTPDLTWSPLSGKQKRWEALLVFTKDEDGLAPGWIKTWGDDRWVRSHWHPHPSKKLAIHMAKSAVLRGIFTGPDGKPLSGANVKLTSINIPREENLDKHMQRMRDHVPGMFGGGVGYQETISRPWLIPNQATETKTDKDGKFSLPGIPQDSIASLEVKHPVARTTQLTVAVREEKPVANEQNVLRCSGFNFELPAGVTIRGRVTIGHGIGGGSPATGATIAMANHNTASGFWGEQFLTDKDGRFEITGLGPDYNEPGYIVAVVGSFKAPIESKRVTLSPDKDNHVKVLKAIPYRLKLTDSTGKPISREVYSTVVQNDPGQVRSSVTSRFDVAKQVETGVYEGIVPTGPGAVIVKRESRRDRPALVNPKQFFAPGRNDWTADESRYAYGDQWQITRPGAITTPRLSSSRNVSLSQLNMAAAVLTNASHKEATLQLEATVYQDDPPQVTLVDQSGQPVTGCRVQRQLKKYNEKDLAATFPLYGLHATRSEIIHFHHDKLGLIGFLRATLTDEPIKVVMKPAATIRGRIVDQDKNASHDFGILVNGPVPPHTFLRNYARKTEQIPKGTFGIRVMPGETYSGEFMRKTYGAWYPRPTLGKAFGPVTPNPGEDVDLGDVIRP